MSNLHINDRLAHAKFRVPSHIIKEITSKPVSQASPSLINVQDLYLLKDSIPLPPLTVLETDRVTFSIIPIIPLRL